MLKILEAQIQATRSSLERHRSSAKALYLIQRPPAAKTELLLISIVVEKQADEPQLSPESKNEP